MIFHCCYQSNVFIDLMTLSDISLGQNILSQLFLLIVTQYRLIANDIQNLQRYGFNTFAARPIFP